MRILKLLFCVVLGLGIGVKAQSQVLDDEFGYDVEEKEVQLEEDHDELFDEMFPKAVVEKPQLTTEDKLNNMAEEVAENLKLKKLKETKISYEEAKSIPTEGEIRIGISKNSFKLKQDMMGRTICTFGVTLTSSLNKEIKSLALRLVYKQSAFAFIFRDVKANGSDEKYIRTNGDICYNLSGAPDIDINRCRIFGANANECAKRIIWDDDIVSPDPEKNPYL
jgi:hypothetical protein